jgi:hypothetical protein
VISTFVITQAVTTLRINMKLSLTSLLLFAVAADGFAPPAREVSSLASIRTSTTLNFGLFPSSKDDDQSSSDKEKGADKEIGLKGLAQLITAGMGAPFLGDYQGVDKETGKLMFTLEANNLVNEKGESKQTSMPYFENGWVDPEDLKKQEGGFKFPWQK